MILEVGRGVDLLALALLMATLRDWLVICQRRVPVVWGWVSYGWKGRGGGKRTPRPGVSMPAVTTRLDRTKEDIRNGSITGSPVSAPCQYFSPYCRKSSRKQRTRMYRRIHHLLRMPQLRRHLRNLAQLIIRNQLLRVLQSLLRYQQHPTTDTPSANILSQVVHSLLTPKPRLWPGVYCP